MFYPEFLYALSEKSLFLPFVALLAGSIILSFKTRFVQIRVIPQMFRLLFGTLFCRKAVDHEHQIHARKALFTAMATTIGIGNIVAPIVAIGFGGPGALLGFFLAMIFGGAPTFTEVTLALKYRKKNPDGTISGGPMQYLKDEIHPILASVYAFTAFILFVAWESNQSNTLATLLEPYHIPTWVSGSVIALIVLFALFGGIKRVGNISEKLVPFMFVLYAGATGWIILSNYEKLPAVFRLIWDSAFNPHALAGAAVGTGLWRALRWGLAKGFYSNEAGVGIASIPHSMAADTSAVDQGILSLVSVYSNGLLCMLSGLTVLITGIWQQPGNHFDITMIVKVLSLYFPFWGPILLSVCAILFAFTTILGNSYNGSQCFLYSTGRKGMWFFYALILLVTFLGAISDVKTVWSITDFFMIPVAVLHMSGIVYIAFKKGSLLHPSRRFAPQENGSEKRS